MTMTLTIIW